MSTFISSNRTDTDKGIPCFSGQTRKPKSLYKTQTHRRCKAIKTWKSYINYQGTSIQVPGITQ